MLENTQNLACEFGEQIVDYIYEEMPNAEKPRFEKHLKSCQKCSAELSEFAFTRSAISEWREVEFSPLVTPKIEIPQAIEEKSPWYASIRNFFTLSPAWMTATTAAATLAICFGLFAVMFSDSRSKDEIAQQSNSKATPSPTTEITDRTPVVSPTIQTTSNAPETLPKPANKASNPKVSRQTVPTKISANANNTKTVKPQTLTIVKTNSPKVETKSNKINDKKTIQKSPSLIDEEEEDDSLRLSDILEQVSMR